jgi:hypothetical protein
LRERQPKVHLVNVTKYGSIGCTDNFINNPLVRVEIEGETGITRGSIRTSSDETKIHD